MCVDVRLCVVLIFPLFGSALLNHHYHVYFYMFADLNDHYNCSNETPWLDKDLSFYYTVHRFVYLFVELYVVILRVSESTKRELGCY